MDDRSRTVVVGVDGSPGSEGAAEFALQEAARLGARLIVVAAFDLPPYWAVAYGMPAPPGAEELAAATRAEAEAQVGKVAQRLSEQERAVPVEIRPAVGDPAAALCDAARDADLLVVGHRGGGGFANLLLGSVAMKCVLHGTCPVTIVPARDRVPAGEAGQFVVPTRHVSQGGEVPMPAVTDAPTNPVQPSDPVRLIMNSTIATVDVGCALLDVADELVADEIGAVLVTSSRGPLGVLSERDVVTALTTARDVATVQAEDMMSTEIVWADPDDSIRAVGIVMRDAGVRHVPVGDGQKALGVVSMRDVLSVLLAES